MKIRTRLSLNLLLILLMMFILIAVTLITNSTIINEMRKMDTSLALAEKASKLVLMTNSGLDRQFDQGQEQWNIVHESMMALLKNTTDPELKNIRDDLVSLKTVFGRIGNEMAVGKDPVRQKTPPSGPEGASRPDRALLAQTGLLSEKILSGLFRITAGTNKKIQEIRSVRSYIMLALTLAMILAAFINSRIAIAKITGPLQKLVAGARLIEQGRFSHRIDDGPGAASGSQGDELVELTTAFNTMSGRIDQYVCELQDEVMEHRRTEKKLAGSLAEKEVLLKEIHHRVKNNMQVISSLLGLQSDYIIDERDRELFRESQNRVHSMAIIHEMLYRSDSLSEIDFRDFIMTIVMELQQTYSAISNNIEISVSSSGFALEISNAIPCGLIVNELISNSFKHAFGQDLGGKISIDLSIDDQGRHVIRYHDNGKGIGREIEINRSKTLGLQLVDSLVSQIKGDIRLDRDGGTTFLIVF